MSSHSNCLCQRFSLGQEEENLNGFIVKESLWCLNEEKTGSILDTLNPNNKILCQSFAGDAELLINIDFSESVNIKSIYLVSQEKKEFDFVSLFMNKVNFSYDIVNDQSDQEFNQIHFSQELHTQLFVNQVKFQRVNSLVILLKGENTDQIALKQIRIIGRGTGSKRGIVNTEYELINFDSKKVQQINNQPAQIC